MTITESRGHAEFIRKESNGEPFRRWINTIPNEGIIRFRVFLNQELLLLTSPDGLREVLVQEVMTSPNHRNLRFYSVSYSGTGY